MRVCLIYDCLYPYTVGGAERWFRSLADELLAAGHEVTYLTRRQWPEGEEPDVQGAQVVGVSPGGPLYTSDGRRTLRAPLQFGVGVFLHLLRNRRRYGAVYCGAFPYFALIAVRLARPRAALGVEWVEIWSREYWREYLGRLGGGIGWAVQKACIHLTPRAYVFSEMNVQRLVAEGLPRAQVVKLSGLYAGPADPADGAGEREPLVLYAGRHIPEKRVETLPAAIATAQRSVPGLRALIVGDGPTRPRVLEAIAQQGLDGAVEVPGFVSGTELAAAFRRASCHVLPSAREGYGMVVIEAAAAGTPSVVVRATDSAAAELIEPGVNGFVAESPEQLADAIVAVHEAGPELRERTLAWFRENSANLSATASARTIVAEYARLAAA